MLTLVRTLYAYTAWANAQVLDTTAELTQEQLLTNDGANESVRDTLVHIVAGQWLWLERWLGRSPNRLWDPVLFPDVAAIRTRWVEVEAASQDFLAGLTESALMRELVYVNMKGDPLTYPLWQQMLHQANHATQHRSEVAVILTRFGHSPGGLDLLVYADEQAGTAPG